jgi:hypothetical protein
MVKWVRYIQQKQGDPDITINDNSYKQTNIPVIQRTIYSSSTDIKYQLSGESFMRLLCYHRRENNLALISRQLFPHQLGNYSLID